MSTDGFASCFNVANSRAKRDMRFAGAKRVVKAFTQSSHDTGAFTVISDPLARSVASCAPVLHSRLLDSNCCKLSAAASRTNRGRYLIARCVTTASEDASVELSLTLSAC